MNHSYAWFVTYMNTVNVIVLHIYKLAMHKNHFCILLVFRQLFQAYDFYQ
jgi:hypothetical protein